MRRPTVAEAKAILARAGVAKSALEPDVLLVPHADLAFSGDCAASAFALLSNPDRPALIVGTWHRPESRLVLGKIGVDDDLDEHSVFINATFLQAAGLQDISFLLFAHVERQLVLNAVAKWRKAHRDGLLVFSVDFTHGATRPAEIARLERPIIDALLKRDCDKFSALVRAHKISIDGPEVLGLMCAILHESPGARGELTCHANSARASWAARDAPSFVSYVAMTFYLHGYAQNNGHGHNGHAQNDELELLTYTERLLAHYAYGDPKPPLPSPGNRFARMSNGVFLGLRNARDETFASMGRFEGDTGGEEKNTGVPPNVVDKITLLVPGLLADAHSGRLGVPFYDDTDLTRVDIKILSPRAQWTPLDRKVTAADQYGFLMTLPKHGRAPPAQATFLPSVWAEHADLSTKPLDALLARLAKKAGRDFSDPHSVQMYRVSHLIRRV